MLLIIFKINYIYKKNNSINHNFMEISKFSLMRGFGCNNAYEDCYQMASKILNIDVFIVDFFIIL